MNITSIKGCIDLPIPNESYLEYWNPTVKELRNLEKYLEENYKVCFVWVYGEVDDLEDYSSLNSYRISQPFWLGKTRETAMEFYKEVRQHIIPRLDQ